MTLGGPPAVFFSYLLAAAVICLAVYAAVSWVWGMVT